MMLKVALLVLLGVCSAMGQTTCDVYCDLMVDANCTGNAANTIRTQYADRAACINTCNNAAWPNGTQGAATGNTLACRIYHAGVANTTGRNDPAHCGHAGFSGGNQCGTYSENLAHYITTCGSAVSATAAGYIPSTDNVAYPDSGKTGNTQACRLYHLSVAYNNGGSLLDAHCGHGSLASYQDVCGKVEDGFCSVVTQACTGANEEYTNLCANFSAANIRPFTSNTNNTAFKAQAGNDLFCRAYHASVATTGNAATHCAHAGKSGDNVCGDTCDVYCDLYEQNCASAGTQYTNRAACKTACAGWTVGTPGQTSFDTAYCRIYHAGVAGFPGPASTHCPHAQENPTAQCVGAFTTAASTTTASTTAPAKSGAAVVVASSVLAVVAAMLSMF